MGGANSVVPEAEAFARDLCYAGLAVSLPGYGTTEAPPGADPKITLYLDVVLDGVSLVKKLPWINAKRLYLYGYSRGAFFAALLGNRIEEIKGVVLQSGAYDLNRFYWDEVWFRPMLNPSGDEDPKLISILPEVRLAARGELDPLVSVQQTNLLREALKAAKIPTNLLFILITVIGLRRMTSKKNHCLSRRNLRVRLPRCCFLIALRSCFAFGLCLASFAERSCWQLNIDDNPLDEKC